jgi:hypothetical protein
VGLNDLNPNPFLGEGKRDEYHAPVIVTPEGITSISQAVQG